MKSTDIATSVILNSVVKVLRLGRSWSLHRCARILSGLKEDFLRDVGKLNSLRTSCNSWRVEELEEVLPATFGCPPRYLWKAELKTYLTHLQQNQ